MTANAGGADRRGGGGDAAQDGVAAAARLSARHPRRLFQLQRAAGVGAWRTARGSQPAERRPTRPTPPRALRAQRRARLRTQAARDDQ
eukprot:6206369-Pleurochrysis_carterae.AAC.1